MMNNIHPTAVVYNGAELGEHNYIGPYVVIGPNVHLGKHNRFEAHASIGMPGEKHGFMRREPGHVLIGDNNIIREFCTVNAGTFRQTVMGDQCVMLRGSHLSHDSLLEDEVTVSCCVMIGGESYVMKGANLGLGALLHQRSVVGSYAMLGMGCIVTKKTPIYPGNVYVGSPARLLRQNIAHIRKHALIEGDLERELDRFLMITKENQQ